MTIVSLGGIRLIKMVEYQGKLIEEKPKKKYSIDKGARGLYDIRNPLNELTGKEWTHFINSVKLTDFASNPDEFRLWKFLQDSIIATNFSTNGINSYAHNLRKAHPTPKPPQLMKEIIEFFTKENGWVLDPFMGVGGTLLGASLCKRNAVGIELLQNYIDIYHKAIKQENLSSQISLLYDARNLNKLEEVKSRTFDLILTDPPYANMMIKKRTGGDRTKFIGETRPFTDDSRDLGNLDYFDYLLTIKDIIEKSVDFLKNKGYVVVFCKDMQPTKEHHNMLHADLVSIFSKINSLRFKGYKIWYDKTINLYPYGYPFSFVANQLHQYILIFRKE